MKFRMSRRDDVRRDLGLAQEEEKVEIDLSVQNEELRRQKKNQAREKLEKEPSYKLVKGISTLFDKYYLDGIAGFFLPAIGDLITSLATLPFLYVSIFKIKSLALTLAVLYNTFLDALIGLIPYVGDLLDFFHKSYAKNYRLIVGYVEDDKEIISEVKRSAIKSVVGILLISFAAYLVFRTVYSLISTLYGWMGCN